MSNNVYPAEFTHEHEQEALNRGFSNVRITAWDGRRKWSRIEMSYKTDGQIYTATWQLAGPGGFAGAMIFTPRGGDDRIRDADGNACHNFGSFADFMDFALADIHKREKRRIDANLSEQAYQARLAKEEELWADVVGS